MSDNPDWLDEALRAERAVSVADAGFAVQVMARLPPRRRGAPRSLLPLSLATGALAAILVSGTGDTVVTALQLLVGEHRLWLAGFLPVALVWAGCAWALTESR